jgi:hypothetical protein
MLRRAALTTESAVLRKVRSATSAFHRWLDLKRLAYSTVKNSKLPASQHNSALVLRSSASGTLLPYVKRQVIGATWTLRAAAADGWI